MIEEPVVFVIHMNQGGLAEDIGFEAARQHLGDIQVAVMPAIAMPEKKASGARSGPLSAAGCARHRLSEYEQAATDAIVGSLRLLV